MGRNLDKFWKYAERIDGRFKCKFCLEYFPGGSARLKSHLSGIKGRGIDICHRVSEDVQAEAFLAVEGSNKKAKNTVDLIVQDDGSNHSGSINGSTKDLQQSTVSDLFKKKNKGEVDYLLAKHFISNNIAFNVIQTSPFQEFVRSVAAYGPDYEVPSYSILKTKAIPDCATEVDEYIKKARKKWVTCGCTLTCDTWSDVDQRAFLNVIAYSSGGAVFMNSSLITHDENTCVIIKDIVSSVIEDIGSHNVVQLITNNVFVSAAADMLSDKYPRMYKTKCAADGVQQLLKDIYEDVQWVRDTIDYAKVIVRHMYGHTTVLSLMRRYTNNRELKHSCMTGYASYFKMLKSLLDVENELRLLIASPEWGGLDYNKGEMTKKVTSIIQNSNFWSQGTEVLQALEPLVQVLRLVEGEGSTSGYLFEAMERAKKTIRERCHNDEAKYMRIWDLFVKRRQENIIHPIHAAAAFLNPSYMCSENFEEDSEMKNGINFVLENLLSNDEIQSFIHQIQIYRAKVSTLFTVTAKTMLKTSHPRVWWDYCGDSLPILKKYAIRILSQPCSSSCERNWSAFEAVQTKKRNRFTPHILNNLVHVRMNMLMMEKFNTMETQDLMPIDLEKLSEPLEHIDPPEEDWEDRVTNLTQDNLNHDTGMFTENVYKGDQAHSVVGNVAHQRSLGELARSTTTCHRGDEGGGFGSTEGSFTQTTFHQELLFAEEDIADLMADLVPESEGREAAQAYTFSL